MTKYTIECSVTPLCSACGKEIAFLMTESRLSDDPFERDNPFERSDRRVLIGACESCFTFSPHAVELYALLRKFVEINASSPPISWAQNIANLNSEATALLAKHGAS